MDIPWGLIIIVLIIILLERLKGAEWLEVLANSNKYQKVVFSVWITASLFLGIYFGLQETYEDFISRIIAGTIYSLIVGALLFTPMIILLAIWRENK